MPVLWLLVHPVTKDGDVGYQQKKIKNFFSKHPKRNNLIIKVFLVHSELKEIKEKSLKI